MTLSRKQFIHSSLVTLAAACLPPLLLRAKGVSSTSLALQLYSVREDMKQNPFDTLQKLSAIGYKNVEHAGYFNGAFYGYSPVEFKKLLGGLGLAMPSGHCVMNASHWDPVRHEFTDAWKKTIDDAATVGQKYIISPWIDESLRKEYDGLLRFLELFNKSGALCRQKGLKFGYHNHNFEFSQTLNGQKVYDLILAHTDPTLVVQQIDIGNMVGAGGKALDILKQYPGRFESMHVKDEIKSSGKGDLGDGFDSTVIGRGILPVHEILNAFQRSGGTTQFVIEQESYQDKTPLENMKDDLMVMKGWGY